MRGKKSNERSLYSLIPSFFLPHSLSRMRLESSMLSFAKMGFPVSQCDFSEVGGDDSDRGKKMQCSFCLLFFYFIFLICCQTFQFSFHPSCRGEALNMCENAPILSILVQIFYSSHTAPTRSISTHEKFPSFYRWMQQFFSGSLCEMKWGSLLAGSSLVWGQVTGLIQITGIIYILTVFNSTDIELTRYRAPVRKREPPETLACLSFLFTVITNAELNFCCVTKDVLFTNIKESHSSWPVAMHEHMMSCFWF